ncbi:MAG: DUF3887 domain-containing protein [Syntrophobacterales bacterium]|nr:DUF3887 domain-containing protein [Syntrophobacterales bacterium]
MMMRWASLLLVGILLGFFALPAAAEVIGDSDAQVQAVADPILNTVLKGFDSGNYGLYSQNFDDTLKDAITEKKFAQVRGGILKTLGKYESRTYLGFLRQGKTTVVLWKGKFTRNDDDVLIRLVLSRRGDKVQVLGLWFQ